MSSEDFTRRNFIRGAGAGLMSAALATSASGIPLAPPDGQLPTLPIPAGRTSKIGFAIVGLGELALEEILPAFGQCEHAVPVALVSGHPEKARKVADFYGIDPKKIYGYDNFDQIKDDPAIQVVYIVLPNHMHAEYTIRALRAGKHVLCEKPMAASSSEARQMIRASQETGKKLMIAYRLHYEPFNLKAMDVMRSGELGKAQVIVAQNMQVTNAPNIRLSRKTAGGPLGDVGIYCLQACRYLTGEEPVEVSGMQYKPSDDPRFAEVPANVMFQLSFPSGAMGMCTAGFNSQESRQFRANCSKGWLELDNAFGYRGQTLHTSQGKAVIKHEIRAADHFAAEMDDYCQRIVADKPAKTPGEEGLRDMIILEKINEAIASGGRVKVGELS